MSKPHFQMILCYVLIAVCTVGTAAFYRSARNRVPRSEVPRNEVVYREGQPMDPLAQAERRILIEDARAYVRQGLMSRQQYLEYTGEEY